MVAPVVSLSGDRAPQQVAVHGAITVVAKFSSVRVRKRLVPLAAALAARPGADGKALARMAHQVATVRA